MLSLHSHHRKQGCFHLKTKDSDSLWEDIETDVGNFNIISTFTFVKETEGEEGKVH